MPVPLPSYLPSSSDSLQLPPPPPPPPPLQRTIRNPQTQAMYDEIEDRIANGLPSTIDSVLSSPDSLADEQHQQRLAQFPFVPHSFHSNLELNNTESNRIRTRMLETFYERFGHNRRREQLSLPPPPSRPAPSYTRSSFEQVHPGASTGFHPQLQNYQAPHPQISAVHPLGRSRIPPSNASSLASTEINSISTLNDLNRFSYESLFSAPPDSVTDNNSNDNNSLSLSMDDMELGFSLRHWEHLSTSMPKDYHDSLDRQLDDFLSERQINGFKYNKYISQKMHNTKKRSYDESILNMADQKQYTKYRFESIRPRLCSFIKPGVVFTNDDEFSLSFNSINELAGKSGFRVDGCISFYDDKHELLEWFKTYPSEKKKFLRVSSNAISFHGQVVDFETNDLRFHPQHWKKLREPLDRVLHADLYLLSGRCKDFYSIYNNKMVKRELTRWMKLSPFHKSTYSQLLISTITCEKCLERIQNRFVLMKLYLSDDMEKVDLLLCVDRETGAMELITSELKEQTVFDNRDTYRPDASHKVFKLACGKYGYSLSSIELA